MPYARGSAQQCKKYCVKTRMEHKTPRALSPWDCALHTLHTSLLAFCAPSPIQQSGLQFSYIERAQMEEEKPSCVLGMKNTWAPKRASARTPPAPRPRLRRAQRTRQLAPGRRGRAPTGVARVKMGRGPNKSQGIPITWLVGNHWAVLRSPAKSD